MFVRWCIIIDVYMDKYRQDIQNLYKIFKNCVNEKISKINCLVDNVEC